MKAIFTLLTLAWASISIAQQVSTFPQLPMTEFYAFDVKGSNMVALGSCSQIWWSNDDGTSWQYDEVSRFYRDVVYSPTKDSEVIYRENGALWVYDLESKELTNVSDQLVTSYGNMAGYHTAGTDVYIFNRAGVVKANTDDWVWSTAWEWADVGNDYPTATAKSGDYFFMGTHLGKIYAYNYVTDEMELVSELLNEIEELTMGTDEIGYAIVEGQSTILSTDDRWNTFNPASGLSESIQPLAYGENVITLNTNRLYRSTDKGATAQYVEMRGPYNSLASDGMFTEDGVLYVVGGASMVLRSYDFGLTFEYVNEVYRGDLYDASVRENGTGYAVGVGGFVLKTEDMGQTWTFADVAAGEEPLYECVYTDAGQLLVSDGSILYRFQDEQLVDSEEMFVRDVIYIEADNSVLLSRTIGGAHEILKSMDGGASWSTVLPLPNAVYDIQQSYDGRLFATTGTTEVMQSRDNGDTWESVDFGLADVQVIEFYNEDVGLFVEGRKMYKSTNGGASKLEVADQYAIRDVHWVDEDHYVYQSRQNFITNLWESKDGGASKDKIFESCSLSNKIIQTPDEQMLTLQRGGHMNKVQVVGMSTSTEQLSTEPTMLAVYPNPIGAGEDLSLDRAYESVTILAMDGTIVYAASVRQSQVSIPVELSTGMYILQALTDDEVRTAKFYVR